MAGNMQAHCSRVVSKRSEQFMFPHFNPHEAALQRGWGGDCNPENQSCLLGSCRIWNLKLQSSSIKYIFFIPVVILCANQSFVKNGDLFLSAMFIFLGFCIFLVFSCFWLQSKVSNTTPKRGSVSAVLAVPVEAVSGVQWGGLPGGPPD